MSLTNTEQIIRKIQDYTLDGEPIREYVIRGTVQKCDQEALRYLSNNAYQTHPLSIMNRNDSGIFRKVGISLVKGVYHGVYEATGGSQEKIRENKYKSKLQLKKKNEEEK